MLKVSVQEGGSISSSYVRQNFGLFFGSGCNNFLRSAFDPAAYW